MPRTCAWGRERPARARLLVTKIVKREDPPRPPRNQSRGALFRRPHADTEKRISWMDETGTSRGRGRLVTRPEWGDTVCHPVRPSSPGSNLGPGRPCQVPTVHPPAAADLPPSICRPRHPSESSGFQKFSLFHRISIFLGLFAQSKSDFEREVLRVVRALEPTCISLFVARFSEIGNAAREKLARGGTPRSGV